MQPLISAFAPSSKGGPRRLAVSDEAIQRIWDAVQKKRFYIPLHDQMVHFASIRRLNIPVHPENEVHFKDVKFEGRK